MFARISGAQTSSKMTLPALSPPEICTSSTCVAWSEGFDFLPEPFAPFALGVFPLVVMDNSLGRTDPPNGGMSRIHTRTIFPTTPTSFSDVVVETACGDMSDVMAWLKADCAIWSQENYNVPQRLTARYIDREVQLLCYYFPLHLLVASVTSGINDYIN